MQQVRNTTEAHIVSADVKADSVDRRGKERVDPVQTITQRPPYSKGGLSFFLPSTDNKNWSIESRHRETGVRDVH